MFSGKLEIKSGKLEIKSAFFVDKAESSIFKLRNF
jgi:hypothetical protein